MKYKLLIAIFVLLVSLNFARAGIETIPFNISYDNNTNILSVWGENLYWNKIMTNVSWTTNLNIIRASEITITNLQEILANMTKMCNTSLNYIPQYLDCQINLTRLQTIQNQSNSSEIALSQCQIDRENYMSQASQIPLLQKEKTDANNQKTYFGIGGLIVGAVAVYFIKKRKEPKEPSEFGEFSPTGR